MQFNYTHYSITLLCILWMVYTPSLHGQIVFSNVPLNINIECDGEIPEVANVSAISSCTGEVDIIFNEEQGTGICPHASVIIRTWLAKDDCGNEKIATQVIEVLDTLAPELSGVPSDITVDCDDIPTVSSGTVTATDNCDNDVDISFEERIIAGECGGSYTLIRTWIGIDDCANTVEDSTILTVIDTIVPELYNIPDDMTVECDNIPTIGIGVIAADNCDSNVDVFFEERTMAGECAGSYTLIRKWIAIDDCANSVEDSIIVTVIDTTAPVFLEEIEDVTIYCDDFPDKPEVVVTDNCSEVEVDFEAYIFQSMPNPIIRYEWIATDHCENEAIIKQDITIVSNLNGNECIWPGDTDKNGHVNQFDLFYIGELFGATGPARPNADLNWQAQSTPLWDQSITNQLDMDINYSNADTNGDGIINEKDLDAIIQNWGNSSLISDRIALEITQEPSSSTGLNTNVSEFFPIAPSMPSDTLEMGSSIRIPINFGSEAAPIENLYNLAFTIDFDSTYFAETSAKVAFDESWLGTPNELIDVQFNTNDGQIHVSVSRIDGTPISGFGKIAELSLIVEDFILFRGETEARNGEIDDFSTIKIQNIFMTFEQSEVVRYAADTLTEIFFVTGETTSTTSLYGENNLRVFPNPVNEQVNISADIKLESIALYHVNGQLVKQFMPRSYQGNYDVSDLPSGVYFIKVETTKESLIQKLLID